MSGRQAVLVYVLERDVYARQAIVSYLSWDRRTRVMGHAGSVQDFFEDTEHERDLIHLHAILLDENICGNAHQLSNEIVKIREIIPDVKIICLSHQPNPETAFLLREAGANAYLLRDEVNLSIASAVEYVMLHDYVVTNEIIEKIKTEINKRATFFELPERRQYPRLTQRIEQALWLCVVEGLPADVAADEMGISTSTIRSYIKEGYRILEASDETEYPLDLSPVELAFLRLTALNQPDDPSSPSPWLSAA